MNGGLTQNFTYRIDTTGIELLRAFVGDNLLLGAMEAKLYPDHVRMEKVSLKPWSKHTDATLSASTGLLLTQLEDEPMYDATIHSGFVFSKEQHPLGQNLDNNGWSFPIMSVEGGDPVVAVEIYSSEFEEAFPSSSTLKTFKHDKHVCFRKRSGKAITLTSQHILSFKGDIEIRHVEPSGFVDPAKERIELRLKLDEAVK
jgi:hypothetical protein